MYTSIHRQDNTIFITGEYTIDNYKIALASIYNAINTAGYFDIILNFSDCSSAFASSMLPLCAAVISARESRVDFTLYLPSNSRLQRLFINTGWAALIEPRQFNDRETRSIAGQVPVISFHDSDEQQSAVNKLVNGILSSVSGLERSDFAAVEWALNELTDNVLNHSLSKVGGLVQLSTFNARARAVGICICDAGVGIPKTLKTAYPNEQPQVDYGITSVRMGN